MVKLSASLLSTDLCDIRKTINILEQSAVDMIHIDVMDGRFVPSITIGHEFVASIRKLTSLPLDIHLMVAKPEGQIAKFAPYSDTLTIHYESSIHLDKLVREIKGYGIRVGIAITPSTHESSVEYLYDIVDTITVMTVNPGASGQSFIASQLKKIAAIKSKIKLYGLDVEISADGGISYQNVNKVVSSGASIIVVGTSLFCDTLDAVQKKVMDMKKLISSTT